MAELTPRDLSALLEQGEAFALATIINRAGSAPRVAGTKMVLRPSGAIIGTVGGGLVEAHVIERAQQVLASGAAGVYGFDLAGELGAGADLICGGRLEVLIERVDGAQAPFFAALATAQTGLALTRFTRIGERAQGIARALLSADGALVACYPASAASAEAGRAWAEVQRELGSHRWPQLFASGELLTLAEPLWDQGAVHIFGAGHVAVPLCARCQEVGFRPMVYDDRSEFASPQRFPTAERVVVLESFAQAIPRSPGLGAADYVVIVTRGHSHDRTVLEQALASQAGYIGMIGSVRKRDALYAALVQQGTSKPVLERVHCPIGLAIRAETPEEIAISIVAELIATRAAQAAR